MRCQTSLCLALLASLCGCPAVSDGSKTAANTNAKAVERRSCFDVYPHTRVERDGYLLELTRLRLLTSKEFPREPFAEGEPCDYYVAADVVIHRTPAGVGLDPTPRHRFKLELSGTEVKRGGWTYSAGGGVDAMVKVAASLERTTHAGAPVRLTLSLVHDDDDKKIETFVFDNIKVPKDRWFWAD